MADITGRNTGQAHIKLVSNKEEKTALNKHKNKRGYWHVQIHTCSRIQLDHEKGGECAVSHLSL